MKGTVSFEGDGSRIGTVATVIQYRLSECTGLTWSGVYAGVV